MYFPVKSQKSSSFRVLHVQRIFLYVPFSFCLPSSDFFSSAFSRDSGGIALCSLSGSTVRRRRVSPGALHLEGPVLGLILPLPVLKFLIFE